MQYVATLSIGVAVPSSKQIIIVQGVAIHINFEVIGIFAHAN